MTKRDYTIATEDNVIIAHACFIDIAQGEPPANEFYPLQEMLSETQYQQLQDIERDIEIADERAQFWSDQQAFLDAAGIDNEASPLQHDLFSAEWSKAASNASWWIDRTRELERERERFLAEIGTRLGIIL